MKLTVSKLQVASLCPASQVLEQTRDYRPKSESGTRKHAFLLRDVYKHGREKALEMIEDEALRAECEAIDTDRIPLDPATVATEVAFAIEVSTGNVRELGRDMSRDEYLALVKPNEVPGIVDVVGLTDDAVVIIDIKTGQPMVPASRSLQLLAGAYAASRVYDRPRAEVAFIYTSRGAWWDKASFDELDLDAFPAMLGAIHARVENARERFAAGEKIPVTPNQHCKHCDAWRNCEAQTSLIRIMAEAPEQIDSEVRYQLTPATARKAYERLKMAEAVIKRAREAVYAYAEREAIDLGDGVYFGATESGKESVNGRAAFNILAEKFGPEVALDACDLETSKAAIKRALRPIAGREGKTLAALERETLDELRKAGAVEKKWTTSVKEYRK